MPGQVLERHGFLLENKKSRESRSRKDAKELDLSHSRTHVRVTGDQAQVCLNRLMPIDLRLNACPIGSVMSTSFHHVAITIWVSESGTYELFIPRGFALSLWEILVKTATQFGVEIS